MSYGVLWMEESPRYEGAPLTTPTRISTVPLYVPLISGRVAAEPVFRSRDDELRGNLSPTARIVEGNAPAASVNVGGYMSQAIPLVALSGFDLTATQGDGVNEIQTVTKAGTVTSGTYDLSAFGVALTLIPYNATAAAVQALFDNGIRRLGGAATCKLGDLVFGGGPLGGTPMTITYEGTLSCTNVAAAIVSSTNLVGGGTYDLTTSTPGSIGTTLLPDGSGLPVGAWRWQSVKRSAAVPKSASLLMAYTEEGAYERGQGFGCSTLALDDAGNWAATMLGLYAYTSANPSLTPSYDAIAVEPMMRDRVVTWRDGSAMVTSLSLSIGNPIVAELNPAVLSRFPGLLRWSNEVGSFCRVTGSVEMDQMDVDDLDSLREASVFAASSHWRTRSKIGSTGALYQMWAEMPSCQYSGGTGPEDLAAKRRHSASFDFEAVYDTVAGYDCRLTFTSGLSTVETYA